MWMNRPWGVYGTSHPVRESMCVRILGSKLTFWKNGIISYLDSLSIVLNRYNQLVGYL